MTDKLTDHQQRLEKLIQGEQVPKDDEFYAFLSGQAIYCILSKSQSADRSYARLEPFMQKTNIKEFKVALQNLFNAYKHESFSNRFSKPFALVMHEEPNEKNIKKLMPFVLGGFFSDCLLFSEETLKTFDKNRQKTK